MVLAIIIQLTKKELLVDKREHIVCITLFKLFISHLNIRLAKSEFLI